MKTRSAKSKGRRLQNQIKELLLETFNELEPDDIRSAIMGETGENSGDYPPVLIFKRNRSKTYAVLELEDFIDLIK